MLKGASDDLLNMTFVCCYKISLKFPTLRDANIIIYFKYNTFLLLFFKCYINNTFTYNN